MAKQHTLERFVAYYRVSTKRQGLGLAAQQADVIRFLAGRPLIAEYQEKESGKRSDRVQLQAALERCRLTGATLVIAKLDRLSRDLHFLTGLRKSGVEFVCCDMPQANRFTIHIMAAIAEQELEMIVARTKASLGAIQAEIARTGSYTTKAGRVITRLGSGRPMDPEVHRQGTLAGAAAVKARSEDFADRLLPVVRDLHQQGKSLREIAAELNQQHILTPRGGLWQAAQVKRIVDRLAA